MRVGIPVSGLMDLDDLGAGWLASVYTVRATASDLEVMKIRRQTVECFANLSGLRFVINGGQPRLDDYRSRLMFEHEQNSDAVVR